MFADGFNETVHLKIFLYMVEVPGSSVEQGSAVVTAVVLVATAAWV